MKGFVEDTIFIVVEVILIVVFAVMLSRSVGAVFNPDKEVAILNTELLRAKINEACLLKPDKGVTLDKFNLPQPKPSRIGGITDFLPAYAISGSGATDPHYVLYYESFPPGEAIGWEAYHRFDTRFIAPFDYAKYMGTNKLTKDNPTITSPADIDGFFKNATQYGQEVLKKAESFRGVSEEGPNEVIYPADAKPEESGWRREEAGVLKPEVDAKDGILTVKTTSLHSVVFLKEEAQPYESVSMEAKLKLKKFGARVRIQEGKVFISVHNAPYKADLKFYQDKIVLENVETKAEHKMDTTDDYHIYKIEMKPDIVNVYVDGQIKLTGKGKSSAENALLWGAGNPDNPNDNEASNSESYWDYVKYVGIVGKLPEEAEEKFQLAKKPVLINNIILSDYRNAIPTETPRPPTSDIRQTTGQQGNVGQWIGDRFEFSDYFGLTKEERAYIKYEPCGENALCLKMRDAVQRFPLDNACKNVKYIQMVYDATGLEWKDLLPAAAIVGEAALLKKLSKPAGDLGKKAGEAPKSAAKTINTDALFKGTATEFITDADDAAIVKKKSAFLGKALGKLGKFGKNAVKTVGKKALGKGPGALKLLLLADIFLHESPELVANVMKSTLAYKNSEFYITSPCQLQGGTMNIKYEEKCERDENLCEEGITYPLYEYRVEFDGTRSVTNVGSHFMCLKAVGKDKEEPEKYEDKYKSEIATKKLPENVACIKIEMHKTKKRDFCWTNNPIFPKKGFFDRVKALAPGKEEAIDAGVGCAVGAALTSAGLVTAVVGCAGGAIISFGTDEAMKVVGLIRDKTPKEELILRLGGLPVTEGTSYLTYTDDEKKADKNKKYLEAVEMGPTDIIGGSAAKRFGEVTKDLFEIHWAWPR